MPAVVIRRGKTTSKKRTPEWYANENRNAVRAGRVAPYPNQAPAAVRGTRNAGSGLAPRPAAVSPAAGPAIQAVAAPAAPAPVPVYSTAQMFDALPGDSARTAGTIGYGRQAYSDLMGNRTKRQDTMSREMGFTFTPDDPVNGRSFAALDYTSNPYSQAAQLRRTWTANKQDTLGNSASSGNIFSGAAQQRQMLDATNEGQDTNTLVGNINSGLGQIDLDTQSGIRDIVTGIMTDRQQDSEDRAQQVVADAIEAANKPAPVPAAAPKAGTTAGAAKWTTSKPWNATSNPIPYSKMSAADKKAYNKWKAKNTDPKWASMNAAYPGGF